MVPQLVHRHAVLITWLAVVLLAGLIISALSGR